MLRDGSNKCMKISAKCTLQWFWRLYSVLLTAASYATFDKVDERCSFFTQSFSHLVLTSELRRTSKTTNNISGIGNQIFELVAGLRVANVFGRRVAVSTSSVKSLGLESVFDFTYERLDERKCEKYIIKDFPNLGYNPSFDNIKENFSEKSTNKLIIKKGFFQTWKYAMDGSLIRQKFLNFKEIIQISVDNYFLNLKLGNWTRSTYDRVGIHVRRRDILSKFYINYGYTTPQASYFIKGMLHCLMIFKQVQFIVARLAGGGLAQSRHDHILSRLA
ncbi:hypothetical protein HELRODRAFT_160736 [Helobdella robusta]|uniref:L-Fucosyltransferase n=1 Tax=Helobdella robusta TaxID=6412 RepID=T1EQN4_HELRO|nr:hypothetical protein HELRODRAFT_160736 [Helobdella robusta]ESO06554.1 hypothetical protein HELRODRAFT_160736 [Helobdella robusta]